MSDIALAYTKVFEYWEELACTADECATTGADVARTLTEWPAARAHRGALFFVQLPGEAAVRVQRSSSGPNWPCAHCGTRHSMLIVQTIEVKGPCRGHGTAILRGMMSARDDACPRGIILQSVVSEGGHALARSMRMTPSKAFGEGSYELCNVVPNAPASPAVTEETTTGAAPAEGAPAQQPPQKRVIVRRKRGSPAAAAAASRGAPAASAVRVVVSGGRRVVFVRRPDGTEAIRVEVSTDETEDDGDAAAEAAMAASEAVGAVTSAADGAPVPKVEFVRRVRMPSPK